MASTEPSTPIDTASAIQWLQELAFRIRRDELSLGENDVIDVTMVIDALKRLELETFKVHELLETETINASVLRYQLHFLPSQISTETKVAVTAARDSNAHQLDTLRENLQSINANIEQTQRKISIMDKHNSILHPERDNNREKHTHIVSQLNHRMSDKASNQIILNETRDRLRESNQQIADLEDGIEQLMEDLHVERIQAKKEKKNLKKAVMDTNAKTKKQQEQNTDKKKEMDGLKQGVARSQKKLESVKKSIHRHEKGLAKLQGQEEKLDEEFDRDRLDNDTMRERGIDIQKSQLRMELDNADERGKLENRLLTLNTDFEKVQRENNNLQSKAGKLSDQLEDHVVSQTSEKDRMKDLNDDLQFDKTKLTELAETISQLHTGNGEMETNMNQLEESHQAAVQSLNTDITDYKDKLLQEQHERMKLQDDLDHISQQTDILKGNHARMMQEMNRKIQDGKRSHQMLTKEGTTLQSQLKVDEADIKTLQNQLKQSKHSYNSMTSTLQNDIKNLETDIMKHKNDIDKKQRRVAAETPGFEELENRFKEYTENFDKRKKDVVALKNKKSSVNDCITRTKRDIDKLDKPKTQLEVQLSASKAQTVEQLKQHSSDVVEIEDKILDVGQKLLKCVEENDKFIQENSDLTTCLNTVEEEITSNRGNIDGLNSTMDSLKATLVQGWIEDNLLTDEVSERDHRFLGEITSLEERTFRRQEHVSAITGQLETELHLMAQFLEALQRKKTTHKRKRVTQSAKTRDSQSQRDDVHSVLQSQRDGALSSCDGNLSQRSVRNGDALMNTSLTQTELKEFL